MTERNALLVAAVTSLTWGLTGIFVRLLPSISPLTVTAGRFVIALAAALPLLVLYRDTRLGFKTILGRPVAYVLALLLVGYYLLATAAFQMAPVAEVALLLSTPPLFVLVIRGIRGERSTRMEIGGAVLAAGGIALILVPQMSFAGDRSVPHFYGNLIAMCAAALTAIYAYLYRILAERGRAPETGGIALLTFAIGSAILVGAVSLTPAPSGLAGLDSGALRVFLGLGLLSTAVPTLGFALASRRLPAMITATISLFIPLFAGVFAYLILGEGLSQLFLAGCALVLLGVAMIVRRGRSRTGD
jgi:drug/metabolite transporter (DMT)-like permease